jgi:hypothetical protein
LFMENAQNRGNIIIAVVLIGLGVLIGLAQLFDVNFWRFIWPFFVIVPGLAFFVGMALGGRAAGPLAIPGSIVTTVGLLLLYQSIFNHYQSWAYAWSLVFPGAVGIGLLIHGAWSGDSNIAKTGRIWLVTGLVIFVVLGAFFELVVQISSRNAGNILWPALMIGIGIWLLTRKAGSSGRPMMEVAPARSNKTQASAPTAPVSRPAPTQFEPLDMERAKKRPSRAKPKDNAPQV